MSRLTRRTRRIALAVTGLAAACALTVPAVAAQAATGYTPNSNEWWFTNWHVQQEVWPVTEGSGVTVAVVDSGVQASESDLRGVVKPGADELGNAGDGQKDYAAPDGHGTAVAALIAGQGVGGGPVGIAPRATILPVHVIYPSTNVGGTPIANGIKYAVDHGAGVINLSIGGAAPSPTSCDPSEQQAVDYALAHNVVVVAGAGDTNKGYGSGPSDPGTCAGVLAVAAVEPNGALWSNSTQGPYVSVAAPGDHMVYLGADGRFTTTGYGTSFSSPLVAGAAALIRSKYPTMPWYTVDQRLIDTAIPTGQVPNNGTGYGIIDIHKALDVPQFPVSASAPNPPYTRYQAYLKSTGQSGSSASGTAAQPSPSATAKSSGRSSLLLIVLIVVLLLVIAAVVLIIVLVTRSRSRRGPRNPGGGYPPPNAFTPPPGQQYPSQPQHPMGQYPPSGQQYPQGQYPAPGQQYPPQGQYPPPRQ